MVSGFVIVNFTHASDAFSAAMHDVSGPLYLLFFAYTGLTMDLLSLQRNWLACILLFFSRCLVSGGAGRTRGALEDECESIFAYTRVLMRIGVTAPQVLARTFVGALS
mmetsp:Transcript_24202/g.56244  ORF Transcript_24202/g.56244 Transcript_24202/m.56244 type:complete len:108 (-) Transcript_24202:1088-1411(-)